MSKLTLISVDRNPAAFAAAVRSTSEEQGFATIAIAPQDSFATEISNCLPELSVSSPDNSEIVCLTYSDTGSLDQALHAQIDRERVSVIIPRLPGHGLDRALYLTSIPKAGTHLLYRFAEALGFRPGVICSDQPAPGHWYCIEYSN